MNDIKIWAIPIHVNESKKQVAAFNFCLENNILGIGWETNKTIVGLDSNYEEFVSKNSNFIGNPKISSFIKIVKQFNEIKKDDLIWTRSGNNYYLCRFTGEKIDYFRNELNESEIKKHQEYDIWHGLKCKMLYVGTSDKVIGTIVNIFCSGGIRRINKNFEETKMFSMKTYNMVSNTKYYDCYDNKNLIISNMRSEDLEELVILYLQLKYNYLVYSNTCKSNTKTYECVLYDNKNFENVYVQIKSGVINLNDDDYKNIYNNFKFYFYSNSNEYKGSKENKNIIIISKRELEDFVNNNKNLISKYII